MIVVTGDDTVEKPSLLRLFLTFMKIGAFTFGGGYAMIPVFEREFVKRYGYIEEDEFANILAMVQSLPGVIAINFAVFIGLRLRGLKGALATSIGVALPSFVIIIVIATFFFQYIDNPVVAAIFSGVRISVVALIFTAGVKLFKQNLHLQGTFLAALTFALVFSVGVHPFFVILMMGTFGYLIFATNEVKKHDIA